MADTIYIRVTAASRPNLEVLVRTTRDGYNKRLADVKKDIRQQKYARWHPFQGAAQIQFEPVELDELVAKKQQQHADTIEQIVDHLLNPTVA
jgi:hypothetical protein